ncbi:hypothetical protein LAZ67_5003224 [Cordylochernes scorpioides]|uniref:Integrase p58-like C-terminal domain-containing protein n=1 Tax=Cordylochernes scorpioides TaxID=51811 RepID=A0ABY6KIY4_9ARAC|nr:hypothetical protein LAZ67_5003224 [Cordylochernes scorpioides]
MTNLFSPTERREVVDRIHKNQRQIILDGKQVKTTPRDPRFPNQNQAVNCWQNYVDYHRCQKPHISKKNFVDTFILFKTSGPTSFAVFTRVKTLTQHLTMFVYENQRDWDQHLPMLLRVYRSAEHDSTGYSPARMLFGHEIRMSCDVLLGRPEETFESTNEYIFRLEERILTNQQWAREKLNFTSEKIKDRYNVKTFNKTFKVGETVWLPNPQWKKGLSLELQYQWEGPYKIIKCLNDVIYQIQKTPTSKPNVVLG